MSATLERTVGKARRRLLLHALFNRLALAWVLALVAGVAWFLAEPWLLQAPAAWLRWAVLGGAAAVATVAALVWTVRTAPTRQAAALEIDTRFGLRERVTTALGLHPRDQDTPAGKAVLSDASAKVEKLAVGEQFPVRLRWHSALVPALAAGLALVVFFYEPNTARTDDQTAVLGKDGKVVDPNAPPQKAPTPFTKKNKPAELERTDKGKELKDLENELNEMIKKYDLDPKRETPEKQRDKVAELTAVEEKVKKFEQEQEKKLEKLEKQLEQLDRLKQDPDFKDGPAKDLNDALSKGDLKKAKEEIDELKKKVKDKKLDKPEQEKLARQLEKMKDEAERLTRNQEREKELEKLIDEAKKENRDAESLQRELDRLKEDSKQSAEAAKDLAQQFEKAKQALEKGDLEQAAEELEKAGQQLEKTEGELQDLQEASEYLQRLKEEREAACKKCQGQGQKSDQLGNKDDAEWSPFTNPASGRRPENKDAKTSSTDERVRGLFDPTGKKTYGGGTRGPAFTKKTTAELGPAIQEAAQEAPQAADSQRLPRDARDAVREYFQKLGGQAPGGNK